ncbi:MAG: glutamate--tRNA ligase, partial [Kaistella sp.]
PANDREILSLEEMVGEFDLHKVHKAGARFSKEKAEWFNHEYLKLISNEEALVLLKNVEGVDITRVSDDKLLKIISLMKERATFIKDIYNDGKFFFEAPADYDEKALKKAWTEQTPALMSDFAEALNETDFNETEGLKQAIHDFAETQGLGMGKVMMPLRLALVGELKGPDVPDILQILGKEESVARIKNAVNNIH